MNEKYTPGPWHRNIKPAKRYPTIYAGRSTHIAVIQTQGLTDEEIEGNCNLVAAATAMYEALKAYEKLDDFHVNCSECDGVVLPEQCEKCFPLADDARLKMRAAIARVEGK